MGGIVFGQVGIDFGVAEVVDRNNLNVMLLPAFVVRPQDVAANAPVAVDCHPNRHVGDAPVLEKVEFYFFPSGSHSSGQPSPILIQVNRFALRWGVTQGRSKASKRQAAAGLRGFRFVRRRSRWSCYTTCQKWCSSILQRRSE